MSTLIPRTFIDELLARADIVDIIDSRVTLKKAGANYTACCPFHNEKTPSFVVSPAKQIYHCFGCGAGGNVLSFTMEYDRLDFVAAIEMLAAQIGLEVPREAAQASPAKAQQANLYQLLEQAAKFYQEQLRKTPQAVAYLKDRNMSGLTAKHFNVGYAPSGWDLLCKYFGEQPAVLEQLALAGMLIKKEDGRYYDRFRERIMFPIRDRRGRIVGFGGRILYEGTPKYLNSPETIIFHKGKELYGLYEALQANRALARVLVVEGYMDVVMLAQHQITYAVATLGTATSTEHIKQLSKVTKEIIFCFDGDQAGQAAAWRALETVLPVIQDEVQIRFLLLPEGDDPDSLIQKESHALFEQRLAEALSLSDFLFKQLSTKANFASLEGKAHFAKLVSNYLKKMPEGFVKHMLYERLGQVVKMDAKKLQQIMGDSSASSVKKAAMPLKIKNISLMRKAIALLLQHPEFAAEMPAEKLTLAHWQLPGHEILKPLLDYLSAAPGLTTASLLEYWRDKPEYPLLSKLAFYEFSIPAEGILAELKGTLSRLQQQNNEYLIEQLLQKAQQQGLSSEEKQQLQQLIAANKQQ